MQLTLERTECLRREGREFPQLALRQLGRQPVHAVGQELDRGREVARLAERAAHQPYDLERGDAWSRGDYRSASSVTQSGAGSPAAAACCAVEDRKVTRWATTLRRERRSPASGSLNGPDPRSAGG